MGEFFGSIYCWFEEFFGIELANYLWGESSLLSQTNSFIGIGWSMFGISFAMVLIYYYVINHPQLVSIRPRACFFPLFSFLPLWLHYNLNPLCVQY